MASGRRVASAIRSLLVLVLTYGSETMIWRENERSKIRAIQMDNLRGLLGIRRMDEVPNARIRELCGVTKGHDERNDKDFTMILPCGENGVCQDC